MSKTFLIVGGYGNTGYLIAELLLDYTDARVIIAGRNEDKAGAAATKLNGMFEGDRASAAYADASDIQSLEKAFAPADMAIMASGTMEYAANAARAALNTRTDYLDTQLSNNNKLAVLRSFEQEIKKSDLFFITDAGFHPGVPAALVRYAALQADSISVANVYSAIKLNWKEYTFSESTVLEMVNEFRDYKPQIIRNGGWQTIPMKEMKKYDFKAPLGKQYCVAMVMNEFDKLPEMVPALREAGFYVTGFNMFTDYIVTPLMITALKISGKWDKKMGRLFSWSLRSFNRPPYLTLLALEADGVKDQKDIHIQVKMSHKDGYYLTAVPIVACLKQYIAGTFRQSGLWYQANIVEPVTFLNDIQNMGIKTEIVTIHK